MPLHLALMEGLAQVAMVHLPVRVHLDLMVKHVNSVSPFNYYTSMFHYSIEKRMRTLSQSGKCPSSEISPFNYLTSMFHNDVNKLLVPSA